MKRKVISAISLSITAYAAGAHAQSSVTLYGIVDTGIAYIHNSGGQSSQWKMSAGNLSGNEWGLKGTEDLGGGLSASFQLENSFDLGSGQLQNDGRMFGRQAFVGLGSTRFGTVTLGRQYDPVTDLVQPITADSYSGLFAPPGDIDNYDDSARFNSAVKWTSPSWGGVTVETMYAFGGVAGSTGSGQSWSAAAAYSGGALSVAGGFLHVDNGNARTSARGTTSADSFFNSAVNAAYATARGIDIGRIGAQYVVGPVTAGAAYSYTRYTSDGASTFAGSQHFQNGSVFASWMATPTFQVIGGYNYTRSGGHSSATYHQANLGVDYLLSKRTDLYATAGYQHASGDNGQGSAQAVIGSYDVNSGANSQIVAIVGLRHKF
ncbi:porin [Burkholderia cenocepacia]|uniref:porin n=1 Tax=Burkholderia cenocepacia TaxID=95486 RepID=UPI0019042D2D|nr:porin [Burkholderia cenocepacia]MBJ9895588.1 porin [Burkholderia cenocepacia]MBJ9915076.1 porin [Burkholderia cenocepacia]MBR8114617.1 porin [Burkholderia cenocepacia]MBR8369129.1 porin [Burkholderia cenocepacia]MBR8385041.1 porin [Burkholderia cenocepacia]